MFTWLRNYIRNHKRKFLYSGVFFGFIFILIRYTRSKLQDLQKRELNDLLDRSRRKLHFESTERTCNTTALMLSSQLRGTIMSCLDCETILNKIKNNCDDKVECWNTLKILTISRTATIIYCYTMFITTLRIQLNVLGGFMYKESSSPEGFKSEKISEKMREEYLSFSNYLIRDGCDQISVLIKKKVEEITTKYSLKDKLTLRDVQQIYWAITSTIAACPQEDPIKNMTKYIISPLFIQKHQNNQPLSQLLDQTIDLIECQEVQELMQLNVRCGFALLIDRVSENFITKTERNDVDMSNGFINDNSKSLRVAQVIPILHKQVLENSTSKDLTSDWMQRLLLSEELKALGANIYESLSY